MNRYFILLFISLLTSCWGKQNEESYRSPESPSPRVEKDSVDSIYNQLKPVNHNSGTIKF